MADSAVIAEENLASGDTLRTRANGPIGWTKNVGLSVKMIAIFHPRT